MIVNGKEMSFKEGITVLELLNELSIDSGKVVVEADMEIIAREEYEDTKLTTESKVEIIRFVGGG